MKLVFCGTPEFAVGTLEAVIAAGHEVCLVVTQPDRAAGRGMETQVGAVKAAALTYGLPVVQPEKIKNNAELRERLEGIAAEPGGLDAILWWLMGGLFRIGCWRCHGMGVSICTGRCCRSTGARRRFSGRWRMGRR